MTSETPRRAGGRNARRQTRSAPLAEHLRPVRAGLEGGQYRPLTQEGMERIHQAALDALEQIGLSEAPRSGIDYMTAAGAILGDDGRLRFPVHWSKMRWLRPIGKSRCMVVIQNTT